MYLEKHIPNRQKGEKIVLFLRRHIIILISRWLLYVLLAFLPLGFYFIIIYNFATFFNHPAGYAFLLLLASVFYLFILLYFFNSFIDYYLDVWIVTNKRIINIEQKGLFHREIAEHNLDKIQDVTGSQKGIFSTFFSFGDVHIQTAGEVQRFIFRQVDNPFDIARTINNLLQEHESDFKNQLFKKFKEIQSEPPKTDKK